MWSNTLLTQLLKIIYPIIQAPMAGGATTPALVANVSNAGGLGSFGAGYLSASTIRTAIKDIRKLTNKPFAVNLFIPEAHYADEQQIIAMRNILEKICAELAITIPIPYAPFSESFSEQIQVVIEERVPVFSFTFGRLDAIYVKKLQENGTLLIGTATTVTEAQILEKDGINIICAQGMEAGGHRGSFLTKAENALIGTMALTSQIVDCVNKPVVATGGIMDGRGIGAALALGAAGVQMGTAFLSCKESGIHPKYKELLLNTKQDNTVLIRAFSGKMARGISNKFTAMMENETYKKQILDYPIQNTLTKSLRAAATKKDLTDYMSLWAGQILIPIRYRRQLQFAPGQELIMRIDNGELRLFTIKHSLEKARALIQKYANNQSLVNKLKKMRRQDANNE